MTARIQPGGTLLPGEPRYESLAKEFASQEFADMVAGRLPPGHVFMFIHQFANLLPMIKEDQRAALRASLGERQNHPVLFHAAKLADGRNRARELVELRKPINFVVFDGTPGELFKFLDDENFKRRHLTFEERLDYAARVARMPHGVNRHTLDSSRELSTSSALPFADQPAPQPASSEPLMTQKDAAERYDVSVASIKRYNTVLDEGIPELQHAVREGGLPVNAAEKIARLPEAEQPAALEKALPNGNRAIMSSRQEPDASLDFFPTPPWATRALVERVLCNPAAYINVENIEDATFWEPACGEGHMAEVLREYSPNVLATDVFDYGYGDAALDFLSDIEVGETKKDFIITNPPFGDKSEGFVLQALKHAHEGVAMFVRLQWLETIGRYERIFRDHPPTLIAFFAERVNLCKGRWDPEGGTATAYIWLVWIKDEKPRAPFWIPPGCRETLTRPDDAVRFTQRPVAKAGPVETSEAAE